MSLGPSPAQEAGRSRSSREGTLESQRARVRPGQGPALGIAGLRTQL